LGPTKFKSGSNSVQKVLIIHELLIKMAEIPINKYIAPVGIIEIEASRNIPENSVEG
jgi:hypothetical protein